MKGRPASARLRSAIARSAGRTLREDPQAPLQVVAARAGVARATLYRHFSSRAGLLAELSLPPDPDGEERVLAAAADLLDRDGLARLSMDEVAARAGMSRAGLYRLFPGKPALFRGLVRKYSPMEAVGALLLELESAPPEVVMPEVARTAARAVGARPGLVRAIVFEVVGDAAESREGTEYALSRGLLVLAAYLARQMEAGRLRTTDPLLALQAFAGPLILHFVSRPLAERALGLAKPLEMAATELADSWIRAMLPDPRSGEASDAA